MLPYEAMLSISESAGRGPTASISTKLEYKASCDQVEKAFFLINQRDGKEIKSILAQRRLKKKQFL